MRNRLFSLLFHNAHYKLFALLLATVLWYFINAGEVTEEKRRLQIQLVTPKEFVIDGGNIRHTEATLKGDKASLMAIPENLEVRLDITGGTGRRTQWINTRDIKPYIDHSSIKVMLRDPYVTFNIERKFSKKVSVKVNQQGVPAEGYIIEKATIDPQKVEIMGLQYDISKIEEVFTEAIDVTGLQQTKSIEAEIASLGLDKVEVNPSKVSVSFLIGEEKINRRFSSIPIEILGTDFQWEVNPKFISIVIQGTPGVLSFVKKEDLRAFAEVRNLLPGKHEMRVQVKIPSETVLIETVPTVAVVEILARKQ